jgi:tetratricopeptide (TPR) repeat protein
MRKRHLSEGEIIELLENRTPSTITKKRTAQMEHFESCDECAGRFNDLARFVAALAQPDVWGGLPAPGQPRTDWLARILALTHKLQRERHGLDAIIDKILTGPPAGWKTKLAIFQHTRTYSMAEALIRRSEAIFAEKPDVAMATAALAVETADELPVNAYPFDFVISVRARASLEYAYILYYRGHMPDALRALDRAEHLFRQDAQEHQLARCALVRAMIYRSIDRIPEAISLAAGAAATFASYGDTARLIKARITQSAMLLHHHNPSEALSICKSIEHEQSLHGTAEYGMVLHNIGLACRDLRKFEQAYEYLTLAIAEFQKHHATAEKTRAEWSLASTLAATARIAEALPLFRNTWAAFFTLGLDTDAALAALELAEILLVTGQPAEVPAICRRLLDHFTRNNMTSRAVTALSFLREAVAAQKATPVLVRSIADFIRDIPKHPEAAFTPPAI